MVEEEKMQDMQNENENENTSELIDDEVEVIEFAPDEEIERLMEELQESQAKAEEYLDGWQRARAEFANYKKRVDREQAQAYQNAASSIFRRFLDVLDDLDRALKNRPQEGDDAVWAEGIDLVYRKFYSILEAEGVSRMEVEGQLFDPNLHEAISQEESDVHQSGQIIAVFKNGYMMGDKVLRPAMVRVAK